MKKLGIVILIIAVLFIGLFLARNIIVKNVLSAGVKAFTGLGLKAESIDVGIPQTHISVQNLQLFNPPDFSDKVMLNMPEIYIDYDLGAFLNRKVHLEEIRINMQEFVVVKNKDGKLNLDSLKAVQAKKKTAEEQKKEKAKLPEIQIDLLKLTIGKVIYKDYSAGGPEPSVREFNINIDEQFENITDPYALSSIILVKALSNTAISRLTNFDLSDLTQDVSAMAQKAAKESVEKISSEAQKAVSDAADTLGEAGKKLTDTFKLPFGK